MRKFKLLFPLIAVLSVVGLTFTSCDSGEDNKEIILSRYQIDADNGGDTYTVTVTTDVDWNAQSSHPTWAIPSKVNNNTLSIEVGKHDGQNPRSATITISGSGAKSVYLRIDQSTTTIKFTVAPSKLTFPAEGGDNFFVVEAPEGITNWTVEVKDNPNWLTASKDSDTPERVNVFCLAQTGGSTKVAQIEIKAAGAQTYNFPVTQSALSGRDLYVGDWVVQGQVQQADGSDDKQWYTFSTNIVANDNNIDPETGKVLPYAEMNKWGGSDWPMMFIFDQESQSLGLESLYYVDKAGGANSGFNYDQQYDFLGQIGGFKSSTEGWRAATPHLPSYTYPDEAVEWFATNPEFQEGKDLYYMGLLYWNREGNVAVPVAVHPDSGLWYNVMFFTKAYWDENATESRSARYLSLENRVYLQPKFNIFAAQTSGASRTIR